MRAVAPSELAAAAPAAVVVAEVPALVAGSEKAEVPVSAAVSVKS